MEDIEPSAVDAKLALVKVGLHRFDDHIYSNMNA
jgi:hypothetical protein